MLKFLRKYNKWILVVGGALLMVAFLLPQTIQELGKGANRHTTYIKVDGGRISAEDAQLGKKEVLALAELGLMDRREKGDRWLLWTYEAERAGMVGGVQSGIDTIDEVADSQAPRVYQQEASQARMMGLPPPDYTKFREAYRASYERRIAGVASSNQLTLDELQRAFAKFQGLNRLANLYSSGPVRVSEQRTIIAGKDRLDAAKIDYVFLPGNLAGLKVPEPDDNALAALFDRFKAVKQGQGEFGIGYTLPARVKVEWIRLDRESWGGLVSVNALDVRNRYLRDNKDKPGISASGPGFEAARPVIEEQIRRETLDRVMAEASRTIRAEIAKATVKLERSGEYLVLPPDWDQRKPDFNALRDQVPQRVKAEVGLNIPAPSVTTRAAAWLTGADLQGLPGIASASVKRGNSSLPFAQLALAVREVYGENPLALQARVPYGPIDDDAGNQYFFTILDSRKESPPDSWTEVRDLLAKDYQNLEGYKLLEKDAAAYAQRAVAEGLDGLIKVPAPSPLLDEADAPKGPIEVHKAVTITRQSAPAQELTGESLKRTVVDTAAQFDPTVAMDLFDVAKRTLAIPVPDHLGLAVIRITGYTPLTTEKLRQSDLILARQLHDDAFKDLKDEPFSLARLRERLHADYPGKSKPDEAEEKPDQADAGS